MDFKSMFQQAGKMKEEISRIQENLGKMTVEGSAGGGMVKVVVNGKQQVQSVTIDPEVLKMNDLNMLQDLVAVSINQAIKASQDMVAAEMGKITAGLGPLGNMLKGL
jgi:nucleoid-associated protein EbfC